MFMKTERRMCLIVWFGLILPFANLLFGTPCSAERSPEGEAVVVVSEAFTMNGGDCHTATGAGGMHISNLIHEGLVGRGYDGRLAPALAKSWEVSEDGLTIKFTLDERAKFHNGEPVTANDVKFSIERTMRPELKYHAGGLLRRHIDRIEVIDDNHISVYFKSPYPAFFEWCTQHLGIVPKAYVEKVGDAEFAKHPIGAGPFRWVDYQQDIFVKAEAVMDHYRKVPAVKKLHINFIREQATIMAMFKAGEADIIQLPASNIPELKNDPKVRIVWSKFVYAPTLLFCDLAFPKEPSPFHDVRVRRAASYAINRKVICEKLMHGAAEIWGDIFAPYNPGVNPNLKPHPYDPEKAKALLKEAGYPNGFDTTFTYGFPLVSKLEIEAIAADLARVGIRAKLVELEIGTYIRNWFEKKFRGLTSGSTAYWNGISHPGVALESFVSSGSHWTYYTTPEIDGTWKKLYILNDENAIANQARKLSRIWHEAEIRYMLWAIHRPFALSPRVRSYKPIPGRVQVVGLEYLELKD